MHISPLFFLGAVAASGRYMGDVRKRLVRPGVLNLSFPRPTAAQKGHGGTGRATRRGGRQRKKGRCNRTGSTHGRGGAVVHDPGACADKRSGGNRLRQGLWTGRGRGGAFLPHPEKWDRSSRRIRWTVGISFHIYPGTFPGAKFRRYFRRRGISFVSKSRLAFARNS